MNSTARGPGDYLRTRRHIAVPVGLVIGLALALAGPGFAQHDAGDAAAGQGESAKTETQPSAGRSHPPRASGRPSTPAGDGRETDSRPGKPPSRAEAETDGASGAADRTAAELRTDDAGGVDTRPETGNRPDSADRDSEPGADPQSHGTRSGGTPEHAASGAPDADGVSARADRAPYRERATTTAATASSNGATLSPSNASRARRERTSERAAASISTPLAQLQAESAAAERMSRDQQLALLEQIAQATMVELSALRDELAAAQLESERLRRLMEDLTRDRRDIPPAVSAGRIPTFGARERWNRLSETVEELEIGIDETFGVRVRLLGTMPGLERDLEAARALTGLPEIATDAALLDLLRDAAEKLRQRVEMSEKLIDAYREQTSVAVDAYDVASRYSAELSQAMVEGRRRGLEARVSGPLSLTTLSGLLADLGRLGELPEAMMETYRMEGTPPSTGAAMVLRALAAVLLVWISVYVWRRAPDWAYRLAEMHFGERQTDDN